MDGFSSASKLLINFPRAFLLALANREILNLPANDLANNPSKVTLNLRRSKFPHRNLHREIRGPVAVFGLSSIN